MTLFVIDILMFGIAFGCMLTAIVMLAAQLGWLPKFWKRK